MIVHHSFAFPRRFMINLMLISFTFPLFLFSGSSLLIENHGGGLSPSADFFFHGTKSPNTRMVYKSYDGKRVQLGTKNVTTAKQEP